MTQEVRISRESAEAPVGVALTFNPWDIWTDSQYRRQRGSQRAKQEQQQQQRRVGRRTACVIPLAVKLAVKGVDDGTITCGRASDTLWPRLSFGSGKPLIASLIEMEH